MPSTLTRRKTIAATLADRERDGERLRRELTRRDLAVIGIGVSIGAGIFVYGAFGQLIAFMIGWDLALELTIGASAVTMGWAGYLNSTLDQVFGITLPESITTPPGEDGVANLIGLVGITLAVLALVVGVGATEFDAATGRPTARSAGTASSAARRSCSSRSSRSTSSRRGGGRHGAWRRTTSSAAHRRWPTRSNGSI